MTRKDFQELLKKVNSGNASAQEEQALWDWYEDFGNDALPEDGILTELEQDELLADIRSKIQPATSIKRSFTLVYRIAAAVVLGGFLVLAGYVYKNYLQEGDMRYSTVPKGERRKLTLADGTMVWLNADSKLSYPKAFAADSREVSLSGEAYFEVKHDASRPFTVHTSTIDIHVLGTIFDVKAYPQDRQVETSLIRGSVRVTINTGTNNGRQVILHPNQKFVLSNAPDARSEQTSIVDNSQTLVNEISGLQLVKETGWRNNSLSFENEQFPDLVPKLERWFDIKVVIQNPQLNNLRFTGTLDNAGLDTVMQALMLSGHFNYRKEGEHTIIIY
ncbi:FecR family protein [Mucilaginibacter sp. FT3.2]|uniref:FecR family protein n=1 Tax=Mucilaginibacter sp. FT3.2 TaxID=2723090 RepID=UPI0016163BF1|nr:FecR domain-containing protein [Mucilaginibacter sp. FT3.2]MBB6233852.1 ferric-dicitrate binding protein FerR (iron transport regulator) [Mucilaginibacter sp. FT3.2]